MAIVGSRTAGTGYTNLSKILNKNQGKKPGMGSTLASGVQQAGLTAQNAIQSERDQFEKGSEENRLTDETRTATGQLINDATSGKIDPTKIGESVSKLQGNTGTYQGPSGVSGQGAGAVGKATSAAGATVGGLLQGQYGRKAGYNPALRRFDETLVSRSPEYEKIRQAQVGAGQVGEQYGRLANYAQDKASTLAAEKRGFTDETQKAITNALTGVEGNIDTALTSARSNADAAVSRLQDKIKNKRLTPDDPDLALLESSGLNLNAIVGSDATPEQIAGFLQSNSDKLTRTMAMSPEQANALRALNALSGKAYGDTDVGITGTVGDQTGVGLGLNGGYNTYAESVANTVKGVEQEYQPKVREAQANLKTVIDLGQELGIDYVPGTDYNMALHNAKVDALQKGNKDLFNKIEAVQNRYVPAASSYNQVTSGAKEALSSYTQGSGKFNTLRDVLGLGGKSSAVESPETFLSGYNNEALDDPRFQRTHTVLNEQMRKDLEEQIGGLDQNDPLYEAKKALRQREIERLNSVTLPKKNPKTIMYKGS